MVLIGRGYKRIIYDYLYPQVLLHAPKVCYLYPLFYLCPLFSQLVTAGNKGDLILISWLESSIGRLCGLMSLWRQWVNDNGRGTELIDSLRCSEFNF